MKTLKRCHGVDLRFLHKRLSDSAGDGAGKNPNRDPCKLMDCNTEGMAADIYTKAFTADDKWNHACELINIVDINELDEAFGRRFKLTRDPKESKDPDAVADGSGDPVAAAAPREGPADRG